MQVAIQLLVTIFKYCLLLTVIRLASTVFNLEFGVSRQYLKILDVLLRLGEKRIEKVESRQKLDRRIAGKYVNWDESCDSSSSSKADDDSLAISSLPKGQQMSSTEISNPRPLKSIIKTRQVNRVRRRSSAPEGPPIFLLEEEDGDDDGCYEHETSVEGLKSKSFEGQYDHVQKTREFQLTDPCKLVVKGISAIIDDQVTKRFATEELKTWNLLTRNTARNNYQFMSRFLGFCWFLGLILRYAILLPMRITFSVVGISWLIVSMSLVSLIPRIIRPHIYRAISLMSFRMLACGITSKLSFHNRQYRAQCGDICVANHTSPIDVVLLACDNCYALVGQRHGGLLGLLERALSRATNHVWFDRAEMRDRLLVSEKLKRHVSNKTNLPVLIFPEGTCINNSAVMMFRKGSFEVTDRVCPVAMKYDARYGDPFWNSSKQSYAGYLLLVMCSWAIKCDVWYLPPMDRLQGESSAEFANRVKAEIAKQAGLEDLSWDGQLKRSVVKETWMHQQQQDYARRLRLE